MRPAGADQLEAALRGFLGVVASAINGYMLFPALPPAAKAAEAKPAPARKEVQLEALKPRSRPPNWALGTGSSMPPLEAGMAFRQGQRLHQRCRMLQAHGRPFAHEPVGHSAGMVLSGVAHALCACRQVGCIRARGVCYCVASKFHRN